jgi:hypothetical protein
MKKVEVIKNIMITIKIRMKKLIITIIIIIIMIIIIIIIIVKEIIKKEIWQCVIMLKMTI